MNVEIEKLEKAKAERDVLAKALEWYAKDYDHALGCSQWDGGAKARAALHAVVGTPPTRDQV